MARNKYLSEFKIKVIEDWKAGLSWHELSKKYSVNRSVISRQIPKFLQNGRISPGHSGGRPRKTTRYDGSLIKGAIQKDHTASVSQVRTSLRLCVSEITIRKRAVEAGLFSRRPAKKPFISAKNKKATLELAKAHINCSVQKWKTVLFSD